MGKYFGTDGFRGEANVVLTVEHAFKVGRYLGWYFGQDHKARIVIGKDTRRSSYMFEYALAAGLTASGADAYLLHVTTTPSVSYVVRTEDFDCGIMISASHNPFYDNGIKVINSAGHKLEAEVEEKIEAYIDGEIGELPLATKEKIGRTVDYAAGRNRYIGHLISVATRSFKDMRVGLDCSNGSSSAIAKSVFDALGAKTYVINNEPDGTNINTDCGSTHIHVLQEFVKEKKLDVGFAYDGDADRCIAVDENGKVIDGDLILYICGKYLMEQGRLEGNTIVTTVMAVEKLMAEVEGDEKTGVQIIARALTAPVKQIAANAGIDGSVVLEKIRESGKTGYGFDAYNEVYCDMIPAGIVDPTKVNRSALENAASIASTLLTTEALVADKPEPPAPAAPAAPDMGGMY